MTSAGKWEIAPPILQEKYSLLDAVVVGGLGISLLNNADTVEIACLAQLINVIAPIINNSGRRNFQTGDLSSVPYAQQIWTWNC